MCGCWEHRSTTLLPLSYVYQTKDHLDKLSYAQFLVLFWSPPFLFCSLPLVMLFLAFSSDSPLCCPCELLVQVASLLLIKFTKGHCTFTMNLSFSKAKLIIPQNIFCHTRKKNNKKETSNYMQGSWTRRESAINARWSCSGG